MAVLEHIATKPSGGWRLISHLWSVAGFAQLLERDRDLDLSWPLGVKEESWGKGVLSSHLKTVLLGVVPPHFLSCLPLPAQPPDPIPAHSCWGTQL